MQQAFVADHALASAAIPVLFPAIRIGSTYYADGGLRMNTPLSPAIHLGADRVLVVALRAGPGVLLKPPARAAPPPAPPPVTPRGDARAIAALFVEGRTNVKPSAD